MINNKAGSALFGIHYIPGSAVAFVETEVTDETSAFMSLTFKGNERKQ